MDPGQDSHETIPLHVARSLLRRWIRSCEDPRRRNVEVARARRLGRQVPERWRRPEAGVVGEAHAGSVLRGECLGRCLAGACVSRILRILRIVRSGIRLWRPPTEQPHGVQVWTPNGLHGLLLQQAVSCKSLTGLVGPARFELATSCTPSKRASQAAPRPDSVMAPSYHRPATHGYRLRPRFTAGCCRASCGAWCRSCFPACAARR